MSDVTAFPQEIARAGIRELSFDEPRLTPQAVERIERLLRAERDVSPVLLDCKALCEVTASGLAALLELGRHAYGLRELALTGLSRPLLLAAIQAGLAERFAIYATHEAGHAQPRRKQRTTVKALIYEQAGAIGAGAVDLAGRPLLIRQLQWLRDLGVEDVVVEVAIGTTAVERGALLLGTDPLTARCVVIPTRCAIGVKELAARAGLGDDELFLALPAHTLAHGPLALADAPTLYRMPSPPFAAQLAGTQLALRSRANDLAGAQPVALEAGWALEVLDLASAHTLACAALGGLAPGVIVHAAEVKPGIWFARGARVSEDATLLPPVLIGADARVLGNARVGPNVLVGKHAVIDREAVLSEAIVAAGTLVGEGMRVRQAQVDPDGITSFAEQARTVVDDPLQLASALDRGPLWTSRLFALLFGLALLLPWTLGFVVRAVLGKRVVRKVPWRGRDLHVGTIGLGLLDALPALYDVVLGRRDLVGVAAPKALELEGARGSGPLRGGALDISWALSPRTSTSTLLWMWRWYLENKTARLDRELFFEQRASIGAALREQKKHAS